MDKETVVHIENEILLNQNKEWNLAICDNMSEPRGYPTCLKEWILLSCQKAYKHVFFKVFLCLVTILVSFHLANKLPQTWWLETTQMYFHTVLESRSPSWFHRAETKISGPCSLQMLYDRIHFLAFSSIYSYIPCIPVLLLLSSIFNPIEQFCFIVHIAFFFLFQISQCLLSVRILVVAVRVHLYNLPFSTS